jgi:RNA polymerase sigma-70 factor (ECF subfamily)
MRNILVDHARNHQAAKRGGQQFRVSLDVDHRAGDAKAPIEFIAVHEALERLDEIDPLKAKIVELRFFGGLSIEEAAEVLDVGHATVERDWKMAKAWLARELK